MDSRYDHLLHEPAVAKRWDAIDAFNPDHYSAGKKSFCVIMPPPNANDPLHVGHALFVAIEDTFVRFHRMMGDSTLWLPGTDHAGIETQFVFEKKLKKNNQSRFQFDRETLFTMIWDYVQENSDVAVNQLKKLGASADWSRFRFTLDPAIVSQVVETFIQLNTDSLIYRDTRLVQYCPKCGTAFSELEVVHQERKDPLYYLKYGPFTIATVRIETKFRDVALAVNPTDPRYQKYLGETITVQGLLGPIEMTVIADDEVDPEFGTGIMKVTPAHDPHDYELGKKHHLPVTPIIDFSGRMDFSWYLDAHQNPQTPDEEKYLKRAQTYHGMKVEAARALMADDLATEGILEKVDKNYTHTVGTCYRCSSVLEPLPLPQFFIRVQPLVEPVLKALDAGQVTIHGAGHDKILKHWLTNLKDWNISRQIVWGIRLPVWYNVDENPLLEVSFLDSDKQLVKGTIGELLSHGTSLDRIKTGLQSVRAPLSAQYLISAASPGTNFIQETDTFDTWFSSGQWPVVTLRSLPKAPNSTQTDFKRFYPTSVMETGYDILPFWVMRMLLLGTYLTQKPPFSDVYLHGLARDQKGQKMSKSKGNVINPLSVIETVGADALRMALVIRSSAGLDKSVGEADFRAMRNFTNKIWNAARFVQTLSSTPETTLAAATSAADSAFLEKMTEITTQVTQALLDFKIGLAADVLYDSFWHWFCDECIEQTKTGQLSVTTLTSGLTTFLKLLHPFMPFVTEAIWTELQLSSKLLVEEAWPETPDLIQ